MTLRIEIVSENRSLVGDDVACEFDETGGTIGRSLESDWILPDPDKYVSSRHAVIDHKGGIYYLVDLSTNGVYVNDEREPIGRGNTRRLFNGDRLRMGDFEMRCAIDHGESIVTPLDDDTSSSGADYAQQRVPEVTLKSGIQLLDEEELTGNEEFQSVLFGKSASAPKTSPKKPAAKPAARKKKAAPKNVPLTADDLFDTFLDGAGLSRADLHPSVDAAAVMQNAGEVMKEFVSGIGKLLVSRANLKTAFRLDQTTVLPRHNNPLKLSENPADSVKQLLVGDAGEYLGPRDAVREVCRDLLFHQDAFLDAMTAAFVEFADRFDPDELTAAFERSMDSKPLFGFMTRLRYWQLYCDLYPVMTERGGGRFPHMFAEEFVKSYERQIAEYKRLEPPGKPLPVLEPLATGMHEDDDETPELARTRKMEHRPPPEPVQDDDFGDELVQTLNEELSQAFDSDAVAAVDDDEPEKASG